MSPDPNGGALDALGAWAQALRLADVPPEVLDAARAQLAHIASRVAATPDAGADRARAYAAHDGDGHILGARTGVGIAALTADDAAGHTVGELLRAVVIGMEIGAAVGLATLLTERVSAASAVPGAAAGAAARAALRGADGAGLTAAVSRAIHHARSSPGADLAATVVAAARASDGAAEAALCSPVADALTPGRWHSRALVLPRLCAPAPLATAVEGVSEILRRHVKAADKRLRAEQIERIEVRVCLAAWAAEQARPCLADRIGRLVAFHALGPEECASTVTVSEGASLDKAAEIADVASRVEVVHDWALTVGMVRGAQPYTGALRPAQIRAVRAALKGSGRWPGLGGVASALGARPDTLLAAPAASGHPLRWPVQIKLYTTRGGWWPERRQDAENTLGDGIAAPFDAALDAAAGVLVGAS